MFSNAFLKTVFVHKECWRSDLGALRGPPRAHKRAPRAPQERPRAPQERPRPPRERPRAAQQQTTKSQERSNSGQDRPKIGQERTKSRPRTAKSRPRAAKSDPRSAKSRFPGSAPALALGGSQISIRDATFKDVLESLQLLSSFTRRTLAFGFVAPQVRHLFR